MIEAIVKRIYFLLKDRKMTGLVLTSKLDVHKTVISEWKAGKSKPSVENLINISKIFDVSLNWLLLGEESEISKPLRANEKQLLNSFEQLDTIEQERIHERILAMLELKNINSTKRKIRVMKVFDLAASAGFGNYLGDDSPYSTYEFDDCLIPIEADYGIRINGDSMEPIIENSSIVWVKGQSAIDNEEIGIFILNGESYCKKLDIDYKNKQVRLISLNKKYAPITINDYDNLRTVGKVLL